MSTYVFADGSLQVPAGWTDQSVHVLAAPGAGPDGGGPPECSVVMHRDVLAAGESLGTYAERQTAQMKATLPQITVLDQRVPLVGGTAAREIELRWMGEQELLRQVQVHVLRGGRVLTLTATAPERLWAKHATTLRAVLASLRLDPPAGGDAGGPARAPGGDPPRA